MIDVYDFYIQSLTQPDFRIDILLQHTTAQIIFLTGQFRIRIPGIGRGDEDNAQLRIGFPQLLHNTADSSTVGIFIIRICRGFDGSAGVIIIQSGTDKQDLHLVKIDLSQISQSILKIIRGCFSDVHGPLDTEILHHKGTYQSGRRNGILGISQPSLRIRSAKNRSSQPTVVAF